MGAARGRRRSGRGKGVKHSTAVYKDAPEAAVE